MVFGGGPTNQGYWIICRRAWEMVRKFVNTAKKVITERKKPIIVFKNGRTTRGAKQAASHTGSLGWNI